jgi:hypothetical protein
LGETKALLSLGVLAWEFQHTLRGFLAYTSLPGPC